MTTAAARLLGTVLLVLGLATTVMAQTQAGRDAYTRGSVSFGCWSVRPTAQDQTSPYYQTGNAASAQACSVSEVPAKHVDHALVPPSGLT